MSNLSQFNNKKNMSLLWDVLLDELCLNINNKSLVNNIRTVFESNINPFTVRTNPKTSIMELNKQFLSQVVLSVNRLFPNFSESRQEQNQIIKRIKITNEEVYEPYKIEDIHASRQTDFEKEVEKKRSELDTYMTPQKPKNLDFSDNYSDGKITEMDSLIAEKLAQRNLDIDQLHNGNYNNNSSTIDPESWLKSKETSVKNEKNIPLSIQNQSTNNKLKHLNINDNNISLNQELKKKVSFVENINENSNIHSSINIFQKLKKQPILEEQSLEHSLEQSSEQNKYIEQPSQPLPEIKQEIINRGELIQKQIIPISPISPIIPKNELINQLNEMNMKMDKLYDMIFQLTNSVKELIPDNTHI